MFKNLEPKLHVIDIKYEVDLGWDFQRIRSALGTLIPLTYNGNWARSSLIPLKTPALMNMFAAD